MKGFCSWCWFLVGGGLFVFAGCGTGPGSEPASQPSPETARNVILFIGDGFGPAQMALGLQYFHRVGERKMALEQLMLDGNTGYSLPVPFEQIVTDSASSASQMATGELTRNESLALDPDGYPVETILESAQQMGLATGLVTNMRLTHATPASFVAHQTSRYNPEGDIADEVLGSGADVLLGAGGRAMVPQGSRVIDTLTDIAPYLDGSSLRSDDRNLIEEARADGYTVVSDRSSLLSNSDSADKLLGVFGASHMPYVLDREWFRLEEVPTLAEMTKSAIDVLSRSEAGFFLMVEGGRIDFAGHDNDAGSMLYEILDFDDALAVGLDFQREHPDTLLIATADHATGGFSFSYDDAHKPEPWELPSGLDYHPDHGYPGREYLDILAAQKASYEVILEEGGSDAASLVDAVREITGLEITLADAEAALAVDENGEIWPKEFRHFYTDLSDASQGTLGRALAKYTMVVWSTGGHTIEPVLTSGRGPGAEKLRGLYRNTHIYSVMKEALDQ